MSDEDKYKQLGLFGVILAEVVITPSVLGGLVYWLMKNSTFQLFGTSAAAVLGLGVGFYRISLLRKSMDSK